MKKYYDITGDLFMALSIIFACTGLILRFFNANIMLGITTLFPATFIKISVYLLLLSIALNVQDLVRK